MKTETQNDSSYRDLAQLILVMALLVFVGWHLSRLTWFLLVDNTPVPVLSHGVSARQGGSEVFSKPTAGLHLFGEKRVVSAAPVVQNKTIAPPTRLNLELKGVFTSQHQDESSAIVAERGRPAKYYRVGDPLPGNAILKEVYSDHIILSRNGRLEKLGFPELQIGKKSKVAAVQPTRMPDRIETPEQFVSVATERLKSDPMKALGSVGLRAVKDGAAQGYVYSGRNPMLSRLNLNKGDVIRSVNGHPLGDIRKDRELLKELYSQGNLEVEVERNGTSFFVNYPLR